MRRIPVDQVVAVPQPDQIGLPKQTQRLIDVSVRVSQHEHPGYYVGLALVSDTGATSAPLLVPLNRVPEVIEALQLAAARAHVILQGGQ